ncbi:hypothetical protein HanRHA438_Chr10g0433411 [Helianthus annuus]|nr:hypothetical protein HanRHA438_Chr10g0433411 [Helianthus annuus]
MTCFTTSPTRAHAGGVQKMEPDLVELVYARMSCGHECSSENPGPRGPVFALLTFCF